MKVENIFKDKRAMKTGIIASAFIIFVIVSFARYYIQVNDINGNLLVHEMGGTWIRAQEPMILNIKSIVTRTTIFRTNIDVGRVPKEVILHFKAFKDASIWVGDVCVYKKNEKDENWNKWRSVNLSPYLGTGRHVLRTEVSNIEGPPALIVSCDALGIKTSEQWIASSDGGPWKNAISADKIIPPEIYNDFPGTYEVFSSKLYIWLPGFLIIFLMCIFCNPKFFSKRICSLIFSASMVRWIIIGLYFILAANNFVKLPIYLGMDHKGHLEYIHFIAKHWQIPLVTDGWSMGEPPLYYFISACIYAPFIKVFSMATVYKILRIIPLICGVIQIEICYRTLKIVYPKREGLQALGTIIGGLLPVNVYISQFLGTEPLFGCLSSIFILYVFKLINNNLIPKAGFFLSMGLFLGLSLLLKISALLLIPPAIFFMFITFFRNYPTAREYFTSTIKNSIIVLSVACAISGWYFIRNYCELGQFIISTTCGAQESAVFLKWWQDPGYRTFSQLMWTGQSLLHPIYSCVFSFWDSLYSTFWADGALSGKTMYAIRPPWNYNFVIASAWLSLLPLAVIVIGIVNIARSITEKRKDSIIFAVFCIAIFIAAILYEFLAVPTYSMAKGKYMLGILPCFAVLAAGGVDCILRKSTKFLKSVTVCLIICWGLTVYIGYFVWEVSDEMKIVDNYTLAKNLISRGRLIEAADQFVDIKHISPEIMSVDPEFIKTLSVRARESIGNKDYKFAIKYLLRIKDLQPNNANNYYNIACVYARLNMIDDSISWLRKAIEMGFHNWKLIMEDPDLENIRKRVEFKTIIESRFIP